MSELYIHGTPSFIKQGHELMLKLRMSVSSNIRRQGHKVILELSINGRSQLHRTGP